MLVGELSEVAQSFYESMCSIMSDSLKDAVDLDYLKKLYKLLDRNMYVTPLTDMSNILTYRFPYESCPIEIIALTLASPGYEFNSDNVQWNEFDERFYVTLWRLIDSIDMRLKQHSDEWSEALAHRNSSGFLRSRDITAYSRERFSRLTVTDIQRLRRNGSVRQLSNLNGVHATFEGFALTQAMM